MSILNKIADWIVRTLSILAILFAFTFSNVKLTNATVIIAEVQTETTSFSFQNEALKTIYKVIKNDFVNTCKSESDLVGYRNWAISGVSNATKTSSSWLQGGKTFAQYKTARGGTETLAKISTSTGTQRISTEFHYVFLTQRMQRAYNLPNRAVNNRLNVWKLKTVQHSLIDQYQSISVVILW